LERRNEDFWIGNLECVCADNVENPFVISSEVLDVVRHLDLYGVANNHSMQIGEIGYRATIDYLESRKILYAGSVERKSVRFEHQGKMVGLLAWSMRPDNFSKSPLYWHLPELSDIENEIALLSDCDYRIAFVHWGYEFINYPNIEQRQLAHWLIDKGVDLVAGMHPHVAQGVEMYNGKHIFYSLGNTVFNMAWEPTRYGLMINVDLSNSEPRVWSDYIFVGNDFFPRVVESVPKQYSHEYLDKLVYTMREDELYFAEAREFTKQYTKANRKAILKSILTMPNKGKAALLTDFFKRRILHK